MYMLKPRHINDIYSKKKSIDKYRLEMMKKLKQEF